MRAVLISIQPKWCELIASGKKTIEVRKTRPKIDTPFKCYIYCTQGKTLDDILTFAEYKNGEYMGDYYANSKVIGEFVCDKITMSFVGYNAEGLPSYWDILDGSCLTPNELVCYGGWKTLYGWYISDLVIYDKPKELSEFWQKGGVFNSKRDNIADLTAIGTQVYKPITRPPQSWCYVEGAEGK